MWYTVYIITVTIIVAIQIATNQTVYDLLLIILQERDMRQFREGLKQEMKLLKQEVDMLPKDARKDTFRRRKEEKEVEQAEKVRKIDIKACRVVT